MSEHEFEADDDGSALVEQRARIDYVRPASIDVDGCCRIKQLIVVPEEFVREIEGRRYEHTPR